MKRLTLLFLMVLAAAQSSARPRQGIYRGVLLLDPAKKIELPFNFTLEYKGRRPLIIIRNADERITVDEIRIKGDSVNFRMPVFDTEFRTKVTAQGGLAGVWINHYRKNENVVPFYATFDEPRRFLREAGTSPRVEGQWKCAFSPGTPNETAAVGSFHHIEQTAHLSGTFLTETGDYRFLEGMLADDTLSLSAFDGSHAFLFTATVRGDSLVNGMFYSGAHWHEQWSGVRDPSFTLRNADSITTIKDSAQPLAFSFKNTRGKIVSLNDKKYRGKPVIVQIMGSWCPNCMDESRYLSGLYKLHRQAGLEIIAVAFERTADEKRAMRQIRRMRERLDIPYEVVLSGATGKDAASRVFPSLSAVTAFPTTIFLDRDHRIRGIHTGFSGPATGKAYDEFRAATDRRINQLLR